MRFKRYKKFVEKIELNGWRIRVDESGPKELQKRYFYCAWKKDKEGKKQEIPFNGLLGFPRKKDIFDCRRCMTKDELVDELLKVDEKHEEHL